MSFLCLLVQERRDHLKTNRPSCKTQQLIKSVLVPQRCSFKWKTFDCRGAIRHNPHKLKSMMTCSKICVFPLKLEAKMKSLRSMETTVKERGAWM